VMLTDELGERVFVSAPKRLDERTFLGRPGLLQPAGILPCTQARGRAAVTCNTQRPHETEELGANASQTSATPIERALREGSE
jgi:hypothetical protein